MAPPDPIQAANASYGICLPDGTEQGIEILISPAAAQQDCEANPNMTVGVQDYDAGMSYAQPLSLTRQPTNVFDASPLRIEARQKRTLISLGDALQIWIHQQEAQGNPVDPRLEDLAQLLHSGRLPDAHDSDFQDLINQSFADTALDAIVHAVALEADSGPNRALHAQALRYSLQYYCQHNTQNPADSAIRQSLVTALANSNNAESRAILAEAGRNASPAIQAQIQQALSSPVAANPSLHNAGGSSPSTHALASNPVIQANNVAARVSLAAVSIAQSLSPNGSTRMMSLPGNQVITSGMLLAGNPASIILATPLALIYPLLSGASSLPSSSRDPLTGSYFTPRANSLGGTENTSLSENQSVPASSPSGMAGVGGELALNDSLVLPLFDHSSTPRDIIYRSLRSLGLSEASTQHILDSLPSPLLLGCASMQGGLHQALMAQATPFSPSSSTGSHYSSAYRVAAISSGVGADLDYEGFGGSPGDSSQGGQSSGQGSGSENPQHDNPEQANPADVYSNKLA